MDLPRPVRTYFEAKAPEDGAALAAAFTPDAVVHDEGGRHRGPNAIRAWWQAGKEAYHHTAEPLAVTERAGKTVVRARVTGDFPGSPATLTFTFGFKGDLIADLEIH